MTSLLSPRYHVCCSNWFVIEAWIIAVYRVSIFITIAWFLSSPAWGDIVDVANSSEFQAALSAASAGDEIALAPGNYPGRFAATGLINVTIRSADPENPAVIDAAGVGEGIKLSSVKGVTIENLVIKNASQNGINIDDGQFVDPTEDLTLRGLVVRDGTGVGIKLTGVERFSVDRVQVINWGAGWVAIDLIGSHDGIIERSYMENSVTGSGNGIQAKGGSANVVIRANRLVNPNERGIQIGGSTTLSLFRPQPPGEVEAAGIVAEGNVILNNGNTGLGIRSAVSFINVADGVFRNNVVVRPSLYAMRILKENRADGFVDTQNGTVANNIFIWNQGDIFEAVNVGSSTDAGSFHFTGNQWYNSTNPGNSSPSLPAPETGGIHGVDPQVDLQGITPWEFSWGKWLVNTSNLGDTYSIGVGEKLMLATPLEGSSLDIGAANPLIGDWTLTPVAAGEFSVDSFSYAVLIASRPGDYDLNGVVDELDYNVWRSEFGSTQASPADGNGNGVVDAADYTIWRDNAMLSSGSGSMNPASVPEPNTLNLGFLCLLAASMTSLRYRQSCTVDSNDSLICR